jgi:hypothetical protein
MTSVIGDQQLTVTSGELSDERRSRISFEGAYTQISRADGSTL